MALRATQYSYGRGWGSASVAASFQGDLRWVHLALIWYLDPYQASESREYPIPIGKTIQAGPNALASAVLVDAGSSAALIGTGYTKIG